METIVINTKTNENAKLILQLVKKMGDTAKILTKQEQEDFLHGNIIQVEKTGKNAKKKPKWTNKQTEKLFEELNLSKKEKTFYRKFRKAIAEARAIEVGELEGIPLEKTLNEI